MVRLAQPLNASSTIWPIEPHTRAKHVILENYLKAWFPILFKWEDKIIYLDGFAGPGLYAGGEIGSPVIALKTALEHKLSERFKEIIFFFIEKDKKRAEVLSSVLKEKFPNLPKNIKYVIKSSEFAPTLEQVLDELEQRGAKLAPTFAFLDPFGFSGFPMKLIGRMMRYDKCEVLITFMVGFVRRFLDEWREPALNELYATDEWKKACDMKEEERVNFLLKLYENQLKTVGGAKYVRSFEMIGPHHQVIYYLVFGTKHPKGLEVMKEAMWRVDPRGTYRFSDITDVNQIYMIDYQDTPHWVPQAALKVYEAFKGKTVSENEICQFVITDTPFIYRKAILKWLEQNKKIIDVTVRRRKFSYPDGCRITFSN
jgi:three-Cys-motif partner protein